MGTLNFLPTFFGWWYKGGLRKLFAYLEALISYFARSFSLVDILRTFFSPWKRLVKERRPGIDGLRDWLLDNFVSRVVAVVMRSGLIAAFFVIFIALILFAGVAIFLWMTLPFAIFFPIIIVMMF